MIILEEYLVNTYEKVAVKSTPSYWGNLLPQTRGWKEQSKEREGEREGER